MTEKKSASDPKELLTPEQEAMWRSRYRDQSKSLGPDEKKAFNKGQRQKLKQMTAADLAKTRTALQAEWDALPVSRKEKIRQKVAEKARKAEGAAK